MLKGLGDSVFVEMVLKEMDEELNDFFFVGFGLHVVNVEYDNNNDMNF